MNWYFILVVLHIVGTALGVGAVTVGEALFFRALKNKRIDESMVETLKTVSQIVWVGLSVLFFSGAFFFVVYRLGAPERLDLAFSSKFWIKMLIVGVLSANGVFMHFKTIPALERLAREGGKLSSPLFQKYAWQFFASGAISFTSWYGALALGAARNFPLTFWQALVVYILILAFAIGVSQMICRRVLDSLSRS
ncbi:MAG: hypothetical protein HYV34_00400 [Candidatus Kerfeldbacteria bacterium]|nr:hypothetical protein [Candidatus Kerfeldbacteria bacterium]